MSELQLCNECGTPVPKTSIGGFCPRCCLELAFPNGDGEETTEPKVGASDPSSAANRSFGGYELLEKLGEGGMGVVHKARQTRLNRIVAVKMLRSGSLASDAEVKRFRIEAQAAARLQHPNIVAIHEVGEHEGHLFFSMDYIQGRSLSQIAGRTPLPPSQAARYTKTIAEAIHYAHAHGVLHRDLKPANVLIDPHDQPRITDFGLAKQTDCEGDMTLSGTVLGTPSYMSPEQASAQRDRIGPATDVYSLGAILYDLLTGRPPFRADSPAETIRQVIERDPAPPRLLNAKVDRDLETICLKCLSKELGRRYDTAQELADDLGRFLNREPIRARRIGRCARVYRWAKRHPSLAALELLFVLIFILMAIAASLSRSDAIESVRAAWLGADAIKLRLNTLGDRVLAIATNPELRAMLSRESGARAPADQTSETNEYRSFLRKQYDKHARNPDGSTSFENLLLMNVSGDVLANYNPQKLAKYLDNLAARDYFGGALSISNGVYISRAFKSQSDEKFKLGVAVCLRDDKGLPMGVLVGMIGTAETPVPTGLKTDRTKTVLIGELDPFPIGGASNPEYGVFWHPGYEPGRTNILSLRHPHLNTLLSVENGYPDVLIDKSYADPVGTENPTYRGRWVAGFSRVPGTHLVLVYQTKDRVFQALFVAGVISGGFAIAGIAVFVRRRLLVKRSQ